MPFDPVFPRSFTAHSVHDHAPALSGVYGLSNAREWIYIGETDNLRETLLAHLREQDAATVEQRATGFVFELCERAGRSGRQDRLVLEYEPAGNRRWSER